MKFAGRISRNLISLTSAEVVSKLTGLISASYLARVINPEGHGILGFAAAFVSYFLLFVTFGFDTYGTREIAKDKGLTEKLVNNIISMRLVFAVIWYIILAVAIMLTGKSLPIKIVVLISGLSLLSGAISINWVFQGIEKMSYIAVRQIFTSILNLAGILIFVRHSNDIYIAAMISIISGIINTLWLLSIYKKLLNPFAFEIDIEYWKRLLKDSFPIAFSALMIAVYYNIDIVILGYLKPESEVGIYSAAYKIFLIAIIPFQLILASFFPALSRIGHRISNEFSNIISRYAFLMFTSGVTSTVILFFFSKYLILLVFGSQYLKAAFPLSILALNAMVISVNMFYGNPLIAWGKQKQYSLVIALGALVNLYLDILLIPEFSYIGAALATLLSEAAVFVGVFYLFHKFTWHRFR